MLLLLKAHTAAEHMAHVSGSHGYTVKEQVPECCTEALFKHINVHHIPMAVSTNIWAWKTKLTVKCEKAVATRIWLQIQSESTSTDLCVRMSSFYSRNEEVNM